MSIVITIIFLLFFFWVKTSKKLDSNRRKFLLIYIVLWWYSAFFSRLQFYHLNPVNTETTWLVIVHVFAFLLGFMLFSRFTKKERFPSVDLIPSLENSIVNFSSNRIFILVLSIATFYVLMKFIFFFQTIMLNNAINVRGDYYEGSLYGGEFVLVNGLFLTPLNCICSALWSYGLLKKWNRVFWLMTVFLILNNSLAGGRLGYTFIAASLIFVIILFDIKIKNKLPQIAGVAVLVYLVIAYIAAARFAGNAELSWNNIKDNGIELTNEQFFTYSAAPVVALDYSLNNNFVKEVGGHSYGGLVFSSAIQLFYTFSSKLGMPFEQPYLEYANHIQDNWINNGNSNWNALYTSVNVYYLDAGLFGVLFYSFMFGIIYCWVISLFYKSKSIWHFFLLAFVFRVVCFSIMNYYFFGSFLFIMVCTFYFLGNKYSARLKRS